MADIDLPRSPAEAKRLGSPTYFTGKPCPKGHISPRKAINACCVACFNEYMRMRWHGDDAFRSARKVSNAKWVAENKAAVRKRQDKWYRDNAEHARAKSRVNGAKWRAEHPDKHAAKERNRRSWKRAAIGEHTAEDIAAIRKAQRDRCASCRLKLHGGGEVDHIKSLKRGGSNHRSNLQLLCEFCNRSKGAKDPIDFMQEKGRLL